MHLIQGRLAIALSFSTVAHVGLVWVVGDDLGSSAAPAQRALTVAMTPAAPRAVLNSIAPSATAALSPAVVQPLEPSTVRFIDEPDTVVSARVVDTVEVLDAPMVQISGPQRTLQAREPQSSTVPMTAAMTVAMAVAKQAEMNVTKARRRHVVEKPVLPPLEPLAATSPTIRSEPIPHRAVAHAPAREAVDGEPGSGTQARASTAVAGQPGADRSALPASGNEPPEYPWSARAQGHQGRVVLSVWVSADGEADELAVLRSSGYPTLDRAAVQAVEHWRFQPARRAGHDTGSMLYVPVVFRLDE